MIRHLLRIVGKTAVAIFAGAYVLGFLTCVTITSTVEHHGTPTVAPAPAAHTVSAPLAPAAGTEPSGTSTSGGVAVSRTFRPSLPAVSPPVVIDGGPQPLNPSITTTTPDGYPVTYGVGDVPGLPAPPDTAYKGPIVVIHISDPTVPLACANDPATCPGP